MRAKARPKFSTCIRECSVASDRVPQGPKEERAGAGLAKPLRRVAHEEPTDAATLSLGVDVDQVDLGISGGAVAGRRAISSGTVPAYATARADAQIAPIVSASSAVSARMRTLSVGDTVRRREDVVPILIGR